MKKILFLIATTLFATPTLADLYYWVPGAEGFEYVNLSSRVYENETIDFWAVSDKGDFKTVSFVNWQANCKSQKIKMKSRITREGGSTILENSNKLNSKWKSVDVGSFEKAVLDAACLPKETEEDLKPILAKFGGLRDKKFDEWGDLNEEAVKDLVLLLTLFHEFKNISELQKYSNHIQEMQNSLQPNNK